MLQQRCQELVLYGVPSQDQFLHLYGLSVVPEMLQMRFPTSNQHKKNRNYLKMSIILKVRHILLWWFPLPPSTTVLSRLRTALAVTSFSSRLF